MLGRLACSEAYEFIQLGHSRKADLPVTHSSPLRERSVECTLVFSPSPLKPHCQGRVMDFVVAAVTLPSQLPYPIISCEL